jgi:hypothetical protein
MKKRLIRKAALPLLLAGAWVLAVLVVGAQSQPLEGREVDLVWSTSDGQRMEIYYAHRLNGVWAEPVRITDDYYDNMYPVIDRDSTGTRWLFWTAYSNGRMELRYTSGRDGTWRESTTLADRMKTNISPSVVIDKEDTVWVAWSANDGGVDDIYVAFKDKNSWSEPAMPHAPNDVPDILPEVGLEDSGNPEVTWQSLQNGALLTLTSRFSGEQWSEPEVSENSEPVESHSETLELPAFVNNTSMVFVRVY